MENENNIKNDDSKINTDEYYYYLSPNQSMNLINTLSISQNLKNMEPQDNHRKSKQRHLLEIDNKLKNIQNKIGDENLQKINNDDYLNYDIKSFTAMKVNKTNRIFQNAFLENNKDSFYKINFIRKTKDDDNILSKNKNKNFIYEKKNINNIKKFGSQNLEIKSNEIENNEREPMDNIRKKFEKSIKEDNEIRKQTYDLMISKQLINEQEENNQNLNINREIINKNENKIENIIENNDLKENIKKENEYNNIIENNNIVFKDIKDYRSKKNDINENTQISNNKLEIIKETKDIEENQIESTNEDNENKNEQINNNNEFNVEMDKETENIIYKEENKNEENNDENELKQNNENETVLEEEKKENIIKEENEENVNAENEENNENYLNESLEEKQNLENIETKELDENEINKININLINENTEQLETDVNINNIGNNQNIVNINEKENKKNKLKEENQVNFIIKAEENKAEISQIFNADKNENKPEKPKNKYKLIKYNSKENISNINIINLEQENERKINKQRERFFSSKEMNFYEKEKPKLKEKQKIKEIYNIKNGKKNKSRMIYKITKNITENNSPINNKNKSVQKNTKKNKHKLINRIRSINISTKHLNFSNRKDSFINELNNYNLNLNINKDKEKNKNTRYNKLNSFSPNISQYQNNNKRSLVKNLSEINLNKIWDKIFNGGEYDIKKELNEVKEDEEIYYYEPGSILNYFSNFNKNNNNNNKKFLSQSVKKEDNKSALRFNNILNNTINTLNESLSKFIDFNFSKNKEHKKEEKIKIKKKEIDVNKLKENINMKNKDIEKIKKSIEMAKKEIRKVEKEIGKFDLWIKNENAENEKLINFLNFFNMNKEN